MMLQTANPSLMQPVIKEFTDTPFVLLHSSYPFTQEAGYLTSVYKNVYRRYLPPALHTSHSKHGTSRLWRSIPHR